MSDTQKLDQILERLGGIEKALAALATHEEIEEITETINYAVDEILQAEQRRDLDAIRADYRAARVAS